MNSSNQKRVIVICGPTAVGKTAAGIRVAKHFNTEIISADSRQCFKELNIGVARPSPSELSEVPHHFIASNSIYDEVTAGTFETFALQKTGELFANYDDVVMVGGTGLYIKAFTEGLDKIPAIDPAIREKIMEAYEQNGLDWLREEIRQKDPDFFSQGETLNPQRMMRALEVVEATGQSILSFRNQEKEKRDFSVIKIGLELPREELIRNIHHRVGMMIQQGLLEEVKGLYPSKDLNALQTVGYAELFDHLDGKITFEKAVEDIKTNTRQYAKRQMTWFKKDTSIKWFSPVETNAIIDYLQ